MTDRTNRQIDAARDAGALARLLIDAGRPLPPRLRERIMTCGPEVVPPLVAQVESILTEYGEPNESWAAIHALELLVDRRAPEAVAPMIRILQETEWDTWVHDYVLRAMPQLGAAAPRPLPAV